MTLRVEWLTELDASARQEAGALMNRVLSVDTNIGYPCPLDTEQTDRVIRALAGELSRGDSELLTVRAEDGSLVGQLSYAQHRVPNCRHLAEIRRFIVDPDHRGRGIVQHAVTYVVEHSEQRGVDVLHCSVRSGTRACQLWTSLGFRTFGIFPDFARERGQHFDCVFMLQTVAELKQRAAASKFRGESAAR
jgi:ribosomal protein S18 acetylase RimI-like enzyme